MSTKVSALTAATNAELTDNSLVYVVTDPAGTPASKKSTAAKIGGLPKSLVDEALLHHTFSTPIAGDYTVGTLFFPLRSGQTCTGVRCYWTGTSVVSLKMQIWEIVGGTYTSKANVTVATSGSAGYFSGTFGSAVALDPKLRYAASLYETTGAVYQNYNTRQSCLPINLRLRDIFYLQHYYGAGDAAPNAADVDTRLYALEPLVQG
jgi:hypothetical protein